MPPKATLLDPIEGRGVAPISAAADAASPSPGPADPSLAATRSATAPQPHHAALSAPAFSPNGSFLAAAGGTAGELDLYDTATGTRRARLRLAAPAAAGSFSPPAAAPGGAATRGGAAFATLMLGSDGLVHNDADTAQWVTATAMHEPGLAAAATAYGAPAGTALLPPGSPAPALVDGGIPAGSLLLAAGDAGVGRIVLWAVSRDGATAVRTAELLHPTPVGAASGGAALGASASASLTATSSALGASAGSGLGASLSSGRGGGSVSGVSSLAFDPSGRTLAAVHSCSARVRLWSVAVSAWGGGLWAAMGARAL